MDFNSSAISDFQIKKVKETIEDNGGKIEKNEEVGSGFRFGGWSAGRERSSKGFNNQSSTKRAEEAKEF